MNPNPIISVWIKPRLAKAGKPSEYKVGETLGVIETLGLILWLTLRLLGIELVLLFDKDKEGGEQLTHAVDSVHLDP